MENKLNQTPRRSCIRIGLHDVARTKPPVIEYCNSHHWRVWLSYNPDMTLGTYYELHDGGGVFLTTIHPDGSMESILIHDRGPDNKKRRYNT